MPFRRFPHDSDSFRHAPCGERTRDPPRRLFPNAPADARVRLGPIGCGAALCDLQPDYTERDWHQAMIVFCDRYRSELRYIDRHRRDVDIDALWPELKNRYSLTV
jgi:hypothetical protein